MVKDGYLYSSSTQKDKNGKKLVSLKANWTKLEQDGIWEQP
jgi:hypothetical protein